MKKKSGLFILDDRNMYRTMVRALTALYRAKPSPEYVGIACLIACYIDAIAAGPGRTTRAKFAAFMESYFKRLSDQLGKALGVKSGAHAFYDRFRNGLAHNFFARDPRLALAEDHELRGKYAGELEVDGRKLVAINIDRLYRDFLALARKRARRPRRGRRA